MAFPLWRPDFTCAAGHRRVAAGAAATLGLSLGLVHGTAGATSCSTVAACVLGTNTGGGYGVEGTAKSNYGIFGTSSSNSGIYGSTTVNATSAAKGKSGIVGYDSSTNKNAFNSGVFGFSANGTGVHAKSTSGYGVFAESNVVGVYGRGFFGVEATTPGDEDQGIGYVALAADSGAVEGTGVTASGGAYGVVASVDETNNINPGAAISASGLGPAPGIATDTEVLDTSQQDFNESFDILTSSTGPGLSIFGGSGTPFYVEASGKVLMAAANASSKDVMSLDSSGNLILAGKLTQSGSPKIVSQRADGTSVATYGARSADPTLEDVGEATVANGVATVPLDPSFASTVNFGRPYFVFLTPEGENEGLYVVQKTPRAFVVREARGGHSTLRVQYRIVASPLDDRSTRLQVLASSPLKQENDRAAKRQELLQRGARNRQQLARMKQTWAARSSSRSAGPGR